MVFVNMFMGTIMVYIYGKNLCYKFLQGDFNMKKIYFVLALIMMVIIFPCCNKKQPMDKKVEQSFSLSEAKAEVEKYMSYIYAEDFEKAKTILSEDMQKKIYVGNVQDTKITGYNITEMNEIGKSAIIKVKVSRVATKSVYSVLDEYSIKISKVKKKYQIDEITSETQKEAFKSGDSIRMKIKSSGKSALLVDRDSFPQYGFSKEDKALLSKIPVVGYDFSLMTFSFSGNKILIAMEKVNSFLSLVNIDDSIAAQGGDQGGGQGGSTGGNAGSVNMTPREKPAGKEVTALDVIMNCKTINLAISPNEKFACVQYVKNKDIKCIRVYDTDSGNMIPVNFEDSYDTSTYDIVFDKFEKDFMIFNVIPKQGKTSKETAKKWQINLKTFKIEKIS